MPYRILADCHTHTIYSRHAYSTIQENIHAAAARGLELLGSTDHFGNMIYDGYDLRDYQFFINQGCWPRVWNGVVLLRGAEADITDLTGRLFGEGVICPCNIVQSPYAEARPLYDRVTAGLDYVVASVHNSDFAAHATATQATEMYIGALQHPKVLILGHTGRSGVRYELDPVLTAARDLHKLIEINEHSIEKGPDSRHWGVCRAIAERCAELGCGISVDTDAHIATDIGHTPRVLQMLEEIHFPEELIINRNRASFLRNMAAAGLRDLTAYADGIGPDPDAAAHTA